MPSFASQVPRYVYYSAPLGGMRMSRAQQYDVMTKSDDFGRERLHASRKGFMILRSLCRGHAFLLLLYSNRYSTLRSKSAGTAIPL